MVTMKKTTALMKRDSAALMNTTCQVVLSSVSVRGHRFTRANGWRCEHCRMPRAETKALLPYEITECPGACVH